MATVAMKGTGPSQMNTMGMSAKNARAGEPDLGRPMGSNLYDRELQARKHYVVRDRRWWLGRRVLGVPVGCWSGERTEHEQSQTGARGHWCDLWRTVWHWV